MNLIVIELRLSGQRRIFRTLSSSVRQEEDLKALRKKSARTFISER